MSSKSGAQATALQTLREVSGGSANAERLDCVRFTAGFSRFSRRLRRLRRVRFWEADFFGLMPTMNDTNSLPLALVKAIHAINAANAANAGHATNIANAASAAGAPGFLASFNAWHIVALLVGGCLMHFYHAVVNGGGYVMIWRRFKYGPTGRPAAATAATNATSPASANAPTVPRFAPTNSRALAAPVRPATANAATPTRPVTLGRPLGSVSSVPTANATAATAVTHATAATPAATTSTAPAPATAAVPGTRVAALLVLALLAFALPVRAALTITPLLNFQSLSGTNVTSAVVISNAYVPPRTLAIQNGGLASTNTGLVDAQLSLDNTSFITIGTFTPSATNAGTYTYTPAMNSVTVYFRAQIRQTNSASVGVQSIQTQ